MINPKLDALLNEEIEILVKMGWSRESASKRACEKLLDDLHFKLRRFKRIKQTALKGITK